MPRLRLLVLVVSSVLAAGLAPGSGARDAGAATMLPDSLLASLADVDSLRAASDFAAAEELIRSLLTAVEASHGDTSLPVAVVLDRLVATLVSGGKAHDPGTRDLAARAVAIRSDLYGPDHPELIPSLLEQGYLLRVSGDLDEAERTFTRVLTIGAAAGDTTSADQIRAIGGLGKVTYRRGQYLEAAGLFGRELALLSAHPRPESDRRVAAARLNRGMALSSGGRYEQAVVELRTALAEFEALLPPEHQFLGNAHNNLGLALQGFGQYHAAERHFAEAVRQKRAVLRRDHPQVAGSLINLGLARQQLGALQSAAAAFDSALAICRASLPPTHHYVASLQNNLGDLAQTQGDWAAAQAHFENALAIHREVSGPNHPKVALSLMKLAGLAGEAGDHDQAETLKLEALAVRQTSLAPDHPQIGRTLVSLAQTARHRGDLDAAASACEAALAVYAASLPSDHPHVARAEIIRGLIARDRGDLTAAEASLSRAQSILESSLGPRHADVADILIVRGGLAAGRGDYSLAAALSDSALAIFTEHLGAGSPQTALALVSRGRWQAAQGLRSAALSDALQAEHIARDHLRLVARGLHQQRALSYAAQRPRGLDLALRVLVGSGAGRQPGLEVGEDAVSQVLDAIVRSRTVVLDEICRSQRRVPADSVLAAIEQDLARVREQLATLTLEGPGDRDAGAYRELVHLVREERDRIERELARERLERGAPPEPEGGLSVILAALAPEQVLVSFVRYAGEGGQRDAAYAAFVSRAGSGPELIPLGKAAVIELAVRTWREAIRDGAVPEGPLAERALAEVGARGEQLRALVWDPLLSAIGEARQVLLVPDGELNLVNFAALPVAEGRYLVDLDPTLHLLAAERDLLRSRPWTASERLVVLAGATFARALGAAGDDTDPLVATRRLAHLPCREVTELVLAPLPRTRHEMAMVRDLWRDGAAPQAVVDTLVGTGATKAAFEQAVAGATAIHLATHGFFLGDDCAGSGISPLLLSGVALDDGLLTAEEIASLDLRAARWVVLSACDTGVGEVSRSEGVLGLRRALQAAGAGTVILSLWPVDDRATEAWMRELYAARFGSGQPVAQALQAASRRVLAARREAGLSSHPLHWAGFVAVGDWR